MSDERKFTPPEMIAEVQEIPARCLISETEYAEEESTEFEDYLRGHEVSVAWQDHLSERTRDKVLFSCWMVPCHAIIVRTPDGESQLFHVQPNKAGSLLTPEQDEALKSLGMDDANAIVYFGKRSHFGNSDRRELKECAGVFLEREVEVETSSWWRLLYDPKTNEIWIDIKDKKILRKYRGFEMREPPEAVSRELSMVRQRVEAAREKRRRQPFENELLARFQDFYDESEKGNHEVVERMFTEAEEYAREHGVELTGGWFTRKEKSDRVQKN